LHFLIDKQRQDISTSLHHVNCEKNQIRIFINMKFKFSKFTGKWKFELSERQVNMFSLLDWESDTSMTINYDLYDIHNTVVLMTS
jgi:uncharacterized protein YeaO (DUF488 family)